MTVKCYYEANEFSEALKVINNSETNNLLSNGTFTPNISDVELTMFDDTPKHVSVEPLYVIYDIISFVIYLRQFFLILAGSVCFFVIERKSFRRYGQ